MSAMIDPGVFVGDSLLIGPLPADKSLAARLRIRSILVPTDFSAGSLHAIDYAARFARQVHARITLLHVIEPLTTPDIEYFPLMIEPQKLVALAQNKLDAMPDDNELESYLFTASRVRNGIVFYEIINAARELEMDLIILSTNGFSGLQHAWLGSTAERVVRHAHCPVLLVGTSDRPAKRKESESGHDGDRNGVQLKRILVPIDFSDPSRRALQFANRLAAAFGASIELVYVIDSLRKLRHVHGLPENLSTAAAELALREKLAGLANEEIDELVPAFSTIRVGRPVEQIIAFAAEREVDMLLISTHGRTGFKHVCLGSVAERVLREAECPVLVVRQ